MIDQNILYAECPCGSGKKFKFCCYPVVRGRLPRNPTQADVTQAIRQQSVSARMPGQPNEIVIADLDRFHDLLRRGTGYLHSERYEDAKDVFLKVKDEFGMFPTGYNNLALCELVQGKLKEAEEWIREVVRKFPADNPFGLAMFADIRYLKGDLPGAMDVIERAERIPPPSVDQAVRLCESMAHFMDHDRIVRYVEKSGYADDPEVALFHGIALANLGRSVNAEKALRVAVRGRQGEFARRILDEVIAGRRPRTICGDWMYFTHESFTLYMGLIQKVKEGGEQQASLSAEIMAELAEVMGNDGLIDMESVIELISSVGSKRSERMLNALRSDASRSEAVRKSADEAYRKLYEKNGFGKRLQKMSTGDLQQVVITEEAATHAPLEPANDEIYHKAVRICLDSDSTKKELAEALRLLEDLHERIPDDPAVANNYASALSRCNRIGESIDVVRECFANHPEYVFGASNYLKLLVLAGRMDEAKAMHDNYRLPQKIHPDAYIAWCKVEMMYYLRMGDQERYKNVESGLSSIMKEMGREEAKAARETCGWGV